MKNAKIQVTLFLRASRVRPDFAPAVRGFSARYTAPVCVQNVEAEVRSSTAEPASY